MQTNKNKSRRQYPVGTAGLRVRRNLSDMQKKEKRRFRAANIAVLLFVIIFVMPETAAAAVNNGSIYPIASNQIQNWPQGPEVACETAVLIDADSGNVMYDKGMNELRYPASITKIMTALLAIENLSMDQQVTFSESSIQAIAVEGSSNMGMKAGEVITVRDCLYGLIIESANEAAVQLAETVSGSETAFADLMNQRAQQIGCQNTHFVNASGLPDDNHYTTAYDMALIFREGLNNSEFREIVSTQTYTIPATNLTGEKMLHTHHPLLAQESTEYYEGCIGGKSGSTIAAGKTLVTGAERNGVTYIAVVMKGADMAPNCADTRNLFDYGFNNFEKIELNEGSVLIPRGVSVDQLEYTEELQEDGRTLLLYSYSGQPVGTAYKEEVNEDLPENLADQEETEKLENELEDQENPEEVSESEKNIFGILTSLSLMQKLLILMVILIVLLIILVIVLIVSERKRSRRKKHKKKKGKTRR